MSKKIKVLIVDDSVLVRKIISDIVNSDSELEVVGTANNGKNAILKNKELNPDVITMDIEMPILDGLAALKYIIETNPKPVIMMSVLTQHGADATFQALDFGAVDFIPKPSSFLSLSVKEIGDLLISKIKSVNKFKVKPRGIGLKDESFLKKKQVEKCFLGDDYKKTTLFKGEKGKSLVGIGTSTGGPSALMKIFGSFPVKFPSPIVVVQHMPEGFTKAFADRLNSISNLNVKEGENGDEVLPGCGYIAPGHSHMEVKKVGNKRFLKIYKASKVSGHMPSIDVLFNSIANKCPGESVAVIMTGMGKDGADGILKIKKGGGYTLAQNEETSVVFGMNRVAVEQGAINEVLPLGKITEKIVEFF